MSKESVFPALTLVRTEATPKKLTLDVTQQGAVAHRGSPLIIAGGPGTGKTSILIECALARIAADQDPDSILLITYGRERASELRDAIALRTTQTMYEPLARTFHSLAFSIMKMKTGTDYYEPILLSGPEQESFIHSLLTGDVEDGYRMWPTDLHDGDDKAGNPLLTQGFVRELRDLMMRANERGISPQQLSERAKISGEKYWASAGDFWQRYKEIMAMREDAAADAKARIDPSELMSVAISYLRSNEALRAQLQSRFKTIMVDEFQESDPAQRELLRLIGGSDLILCADGDSAVGRFRGADPDGLSRELDFYIDRGARTIDLTYSYRSRPEIFALGKSIAQKFPAAAATRHRECVYLGCNEIESPLIVSRLHSQSEEAAFIAYQFKRAHLMQGIAYSNMAVILRSPGSQASALRRAFAHVSIPVAGDLAAIASNPAIAPFLLLARIATGEPLTLEISEQLLTSEFGGADSISLRRARAALVAARDDENDKRAGTQLIIDAIDKGDIPIEDKAALTRVYELLHVARACLRKRDVRVEDLLWAIWDGARTSDNEKLSTSWRKLALRGGNRGAAADRDLDAMIQLFDSASRFTERFPGSRPAAFLDEISKESIAGDIITAKGARADLVEILTVHAAKGREWDVVAIAGLQEGTWPNLRQRSSLLGSERLVERVRHGDLPRAQLDLIAYSSLAHDERRLLYVALTRARQALVVTAVQRDDDEPSAFFEEVFEHVYSDLVEAPAITEVPRPLTAPALVSNLRRALAGEQAQMAASLLKTLSLAGISGADPREWIGSHLPSSSAPVVAEQALVQVSPSGAETFTECGVKWFLEKSGGTNGDSTAQILGSAIHEFARMKVAQPDLSLDEMIATLKSSWSLIDQSQGWISAGQLTRAIDMIKRFARYHEASVREVFGVELPFEYTIGRAHVKGSIDRVEIAADGSVFIIDFKTGKNVLSKEKAADNLQLAAYQLAVLLGGFKENSPGSVSGGAALVYLAHPAAKVSTRQQVVINKDEIEEKLSEIAQGMGAATFTARINTMCKQCVVKSSCPVQSDGRTVIE